MKLVFTAAVMDLLHYGHINLLETMRQRGDMTLLVLHDDLSTYKNKQRFPVDPLERRATHIIETGLVDILMYTYSQAPEAEFIAIIERFRDRLGFELLFMRGDDWMKFPACNVINQHNVPVEFVRYTEGVSSSLIREEVRH